MSYRVQSVRPIRTAKFEFLSDEPILSSTNSIKRLKKYARFADSETKQATSRNQRKPKRSIYEYRNHPGHSPSPTRVCHSKVTIMSMQAALTLQLQALEWE